MQWGEGCGWWLVVVINGLFINKINLFVQIAAVCGIIFGATSIAGGGVVVAAAAAENSTLAGEAFVEQGPTIYFTSHIRRSKCWRQAVDGKGSSGSRGM